MVTGDLSMWTRETVERHSVDMRQFIDFRQSRLPNGLRVIEAYNSSGLSFTLLPDRGLDIWLASYQGLPLTWISQGSPLLPDSARLWLRQFSGGLMTTCGLTHAGPPEVDPETGESRDLHGRFSMLQAEDVCVSGRWLAQDGQPERYVVELNGEVSEAILFGEQLRLKRTYRMALGDPALEVVDTVENRGDMPAPLMVLYHCNVGFPLVAEGARLYTASENVYARDAAARVGLHRWAEYDAPEAGYAEQVFFHHVKTNPSGWTEAALLRDNFGVSFQWKASAMPYLTQWKNTRQGIYVSGIEPGNCIPEGRTAARRKHRLQELAPGESVCFEQRMTPLSGQIAVAACQARINALAESGDPVGGCLLDDYAM
jgi:hypothetical protein